MQQDIEQNFWKENYQSATMAQYINLIESWNIMRAVH